MRFPPPLVLIAFACGCAQPNLRPGWIRTAGSAYACPSSQLASADTSRGYWGRDPRTFDLGTPVCELIVRANMPTRVVPDRQNAGSVRETWMYDLPADATGTHVAVLTLEGLTRPEMVVTAHRVVTTPASTPQQQTGGRRRRGS